MDFEQFAAQQIAETEARDYGGDMPAHNKATLRKQLEEEDKFWTRFDRDHVSGKDDGEPPMGAKW